MKRNGLPAPTRAFHRQAQARPCCMHPLGPPTPSPSPTLSAHAEPISQFHSRIWSWKSHDTYLCHWLVKALYITVSGRYSLLLQKMYRRVLLVQVTPFPSNPLLHVHTKLPITSVQVAFALQLSISSSHSSIFAHRDEIHKVISMLSSSGKHIH